MTLPNPTTRKAAPRRFRGARWALLSLALGACADNSLPMSPGFGEANRQNAARQIVNPDPPPPTEDARMVDGNKVVLGVEAYKTDKVKKPIILRASSAGGGGGSSGGGSSGGGSN